MIISVDVRLPFSRSLVYKTYRDKLCDLIPYLPNVRNIEVKSRTEKNGLICLVNVWHGGGEIPIAARAILSDAMLSWTDTATWNESDFTTKWQINTHAFTEAVHCVGQNRFLEDKDGTLIESRGELKINPKHVTGVPHFLAGTVAGIIEDYLGKQVAPNLVKMGEGVCQYLTKHGMD